MDTAAISKIRDDLGLVAAEARKALRMARATGDERLTVDLASFIKKVDACIADTERIAKEVT